MLHASSQTMSTTRYPYQVQYHCPHYYASSIFVFTQHISDIAVDVVDLSVTARVIRIEYLRAHPEIRVLISYEGKVLGRDSLQGWQWTSTMDVVGSVGMRGCSNRQLIGVFCNQTLTQHWAAYLATAQIQTLESLGNVCSRAIEHQRTLIVIIKVKCREVLLLESNQDKLGKAIR